MTINLMFLGAIAMANFMISLFFLRFFRDTRDRFFLFFALAFGIEGINRIVLGLTESLKEDAPVIYLIRLFTFILILYAIVDKNRGSAVSRK